MYVAIGLSTTAVPARPVVSATAVTVGGALVASTMAALVSVVQRWGVPRSHTVTANLLVPLSTGVKAGLASVGSSSPVDGDHE